jgi:hypothetical protein
LVTCQEQVQQMGSRPRNSGMWKPGQSGIPKGKPPGQLNRRTQQVLAELQVKGLAPDAIGAMAEIALDPREPKQLRIQATSVVLPYCLPRLQVTAHMTRASGDFSSARTKEELMEMVSAELGEGAVGVLRRVMDGLERGNDVIDAEVIPQPSAAAEQRLSERAPEPELAKP